MGFEETYTDRKSGECYLRGKLVPCAHYHEPSFSSKEFEIKKNVPILDAHKGEEKKYDVGEDLLKLIIKNNNERQKERKYTTLIIGHTPDEEHGYVPEKKYPEVVGYAKDFKLGVFDKKPCILADFYIYRNKVKYASTFPFRSVERVFPKEDVHAPQKNYIDCISLIRRRPARPLGLIRYGDREDLSLINKSSYSFKSQEEDSDMGITPEDLKAIIEGVVSGVAAVLEGHATDLEGEEEFPEAPPEEELEGNAPEEELEGSMPEEEGEEMPKEEEVEEEEEKFEAEDEDEDEEKESEEDEDEEEEKNMSGPVSPSGANTHVRAPVVKKEKAKNLGFVKKIKEKKYSAEIEEVRKYFDKQLQERDKKIDKLNGKLLQTEIERRKAKYALELSELERQGYSFNSEKELKRLVKLTPDQAQERLDDIKENYTREPIGLNGINLAEGIVRDGDITMNDDIVRYAQEHNLWDPIECVKAYKADKKSGKIKS